MSPSSLTNLSARFLDNVPAVVFFLLLFDSFHLVFAKMLAPFLPPAVSAMYVLGIAAVEFAVIIALRGGINWHVLADNLWFFAAVGFLVAAATILSYTSINYIDPGTASLLSRASTLFSLGFGILWLKDRLNVLGWSGAILAIVGVCIISFQPGDYLRLGAFFILGSSFVYALHAAVVKRYSAELEFTNFFLFRVGSTAFFLLLYVLGSGQLILPSAQAWLILLITGTVDVILSRVLYYLVLRRIEMSFHALILTLSPVITIGWSWLLFAEWPTWQGALGGLAVIGGVALVTRSKQVQRQKVAAPAIK